MSGAYMYQVMSVCGMNKWLPRAVHEGWEVEEPRRPVLVPHMNAKT